MSNEEFLKKQNEQDAAHMLMVEFVKRNAGDVARALETIIPLHNEVTYDTLERGMGVVNQTFASIALQLIDHNSGLEPGDPDSLTLPVGAKTMNETIEEMSKFIHSVKLLLWMVNEKFDDDPAVKLVRDAFWDYEPQF